MKIPKYIDKLLDRRAKLALGLIDVDFVVSDWIEKNGIEVASEDYLTGVEMYSNPIDSADRIREAILRKE